jgi:hypothetical protein
MSDFFIAVKPYLDHYGYWALFGGLAAVTLGLAIHFLRRTRG